MCKWAVKFDRLRECVHTCYLSAVVALRTHSLYNFGPQQVWHLQSCWSSRRLTSSCTHQGFPEALQLVGQKPLGQKFLPG